jgi:hypothetical protein
MNFKTTYNVELGLNFSTGFNSKRSIHIPYINPSVIFNIYNLKKYKNFDYIDSDIGENYIVENFIKNFIKKQFKYQHIGIIERVDLIRKFNNYGIPYYSAFCHFNQWFYNKITIYIQNLLNIRCNYDLFYEEKSYWIITDNISPLDNETAILHNKIHEQQYKIMTKIGYKRNDYRYRYNQNIVQISDFVFRNPHGKNKGELKYIINEQSYLLSILCV